GHVRDVHHRSVEPRRVPAAAPATAAGRVGYGAASRPRRRGGGRIARRRVEPGGIPRLASSGTGTPAGGVPVGARTAGPLLSPDRRPSSATRGVERFLARGRPSGRRIPNGTRTRGSDPDGAGVG